MASLSNIMRPLARNATSAARSTPRPAPARSFHSPFVVLGNSPLTAPPSASSNVSSVYEKYNEHYNEPFISSSGTRTYVVSEPDASTRHYQVPAGAYPTSAPYVNFTATEAPDFEGAQTSSTSSSIFAHQFTTRAARQHRGGVGESSAVRHQSAPGEMGARGGGYGGLGIMDKNGTTAGIGELGARNPPPDGAAAESFSKAGVDNAWKLRK
ncbi:hypothetical protein BDQ12DRAFT_680402 [Crucibulum laeve]|uniref:Uncharacterized protein n=1 Tax=Crucibulum laeve TaxID=68775 RepID=A0A5C3M3Y2_9AGAR|nr:hypothetical protein BDQ12DRAFT_680402 [Crucibulum laeve]